MSLLSLNSHVAYGYVGNTAASFALRRLGIEVWPVHTVDLSNHPGYGAARGRVTCPSHMREVVAGLAERGVLSACTGVVSGYLGAADQGAEVLRALETVRAASPEAPYLLDPVMGDAEPGLYVSREIAAFLGGEALDKADIVTPNAFELGMLAGMQVRDLQTARAAARAVLDRGPRLVVVTSLPLDGGMMGVMAVTAEAAWLVRVPHLRFEVAPNGAGDLFAALLAGACFHGTETPVALGRTANAVHVVLQATQAARRRELDLIGAQDALAAPPVTLHIESL